MSNPDFIGVYDDVLTSDQCDDLISFFESSPQQHGKVWQHGELKINNQVKKNIELKDSFLSKTPLVSDILCKCIYDYKKEYLSLNTISRWSLIDAYTFQKLQYYDDGYKEWHCEHAPAKSCAKRILAWMFYLNDAKSGTEFMHYPTVQAKRGRCIIWPASFTHLHKSVPNKGLKYIMSGWISYE